MEEDGAGNQTVHHFDGKKRLVAVEDALGHLTEKRYDGGNHVIAAIDPRGNVTQNEYDGADNLVKTTNALNKDTLFTYDALYHPTGVTDPLGNVVHSDFDGEHHPAATTVWPAEGSPITTARTYHANGLPATMTDGRGMVTTFTHDNYGNPAATQTGPHPAVTLQYSPIGLMTSLTDQAGARSTFTYDNRGLVRTRTDPLGKTTATTYDNDGRMQSRTDRNNRTITYAYTPSGKLAAVTYPDTSVTSYTYDPRDLLVERRDGLGTTSYASDALGRVTSMTDPHGFTTGYQYDEAGNLTRLAYPDGKAVSYTYDAANRLATVSIGWLGKTASYEYDAAGRITGLTQFNGTVSRYGYDNANRLTDLENLTAAAGTAIAVYHFTLDSNGNRVQSAQEAPATPAISPASLAMTYNAQRNRLLTADSASFTYDGEGQLASRAADSYTFDYEHRLTGITGTVNQQFKYDGAGNRLEANRNGAITRYVYDQFGNLLAEADAANTITRYYIHGAGLMALVTPDNVLHCYHFDATGHAVALTDSNKQTVNYYAYTPFGTLAGEVEAIPQPYKFVGQHGVMSEPNGLYYMRARYYDPRVGRFISEDPLGFDGGDVNLYAYVQNNPIMGVDPSGLCGESLWNKAGQIMPNVRIGIDSPVGGAATTLPFNTGGVPTTVQTSPSWNVPIGPGMNMKFSGAVDPSAAALEGRVTISTPLSGLRGSIDNNGQTKLNLLGPQLNLPLGYGVNAYIGTSW